MAHYRRRDRVPHREPIRLTLALVALLSLCAAAPAAATCKVVPYSALSGSVSALVCDTSAELPTTGVSDGTFASVKGDATLYCRFSAAWGPCSAAGSGDILDVWTCASGNCNALTATSGDTLDAGSANSTIPWRVNNTAAPTTEGLAIWDANDNWLTVGDGAATQFLYPGFRAGSSTNGGSATTALDLSCSNCIGGAEIDGTVGIAELEAGVAAPWNNYDANRPPASFGTGGFREDWLADTASQTWTWGNQDGSSETLLRDGAYLSGDGTDEFHARCTPAATNADQTWTVRLWPHNFGIANNGAGVGVVSGGSTASPTEIAALWYQDAATDQFVWASDTDWLPAAGATTNATSAAWSIAELRLVPICWQLRYTDAFRTLTAWLAFSSCRGFVQLGGTINLTADPVSWCYLVRDDGEADVEWAQLRTDANRDMASD